MKLIVIEGIDGAGKTTLSNLLAERLVELGYDAIVTHEPFTDEIKMLLENVGWKDPLVLTFLFSADRAIHVNWLRDAGKGIIIMDRYYYSTMAYQAALGLDLKWLETVSSVFPKPDLVLLIDLPVEVALMRLSRKRDSLDFKEKRETLSKVRENYLSLARKYNMIILDGKRDLRELTEHALTHVLQTLSS